MDRTLLFETLNKIASTTGKIRFLEKTMFEEPEENRIEILKLIKSLKKGEKVSIEASIQQKQEELSASTVEDVVTVAESKPAVAPSPEPGPRSLPGEIPDVEETIEEAVAPTAAAVAPILAELGLEARPPSSYIANRDLDTRTGYNPFTERTTNSYRQHETPDANLIPQMGLRQEDEEQGNVGEGYKRADVFKAGREKQKQEEGYRRKQDLGLI
jgi:hypothetical protein